MGANPRETIITPASVKPATFGRLFSWYVDGAVFAQPLYVPALAFPGKGVADRAGPPFRLPVLPTRLRSLRLVMSMTGTGVIPASSSVKSRSQVYPPSTSTDCCLSP